MLRRTGQASSRRFCQGRHQCWVAVEHLCRFPDLDDLVLRQPQEAEHLEFHGPRIVGSQLDDMPIGARLAAVSAILIWVGVLFCGRMLPALGNSF